MRFLSLLLLLSFSSCGYQFVSGTRNPHYQTVTVPYAEGDLDGSFTKELIKQITVSGVYQYSRTDANLILKVVLVNYYDDNIGFRYYVKEVKNKDSGKEQNLDPEDKQEKQIRYKLTHETIPVETRSHVIAEVSLIDANSGLVILNPVLISAYTDFDHDFYSTRGGINVKSLGQLSDIDEALDASKKPLHFNLARKIVDYLSDTW